MTTQAEITNASGGANVLKWISAIVLLIVATLGNRYAPEVLPQVPVWVRIALLVVAGIAAAFVLLTTSQGRGFVKLLKEAQVEAKRVTWPKPEETWQTTLIVLAVVVVMSLVLWGLDTLFGWMISAIIG
ncbi:protein translocase subunit secE/sec61 gamma [Fluviicoccus keumensis]|uniref:Protein translocase subunit SecE n=1 Tax=Fluviicoccus keumensis TaxID=1435465 RepID=A0A4Q7ZBK3_9GAMM|nr:preprotein translocase subunit SecE [Fluviicoccus keumensis]RZU47353.1 protein translocase subunit secE/sec61 gamma [Fluviicoccus keumensis]